MTKQNIITALRKELQCVIQERHTAKSDPKTLAARFALKHFQSERMACTHADLLAAPESNIAAKFFLTDLYGAQDMTQRDADIERIIPVMEKLLPVPALATITEAVMLDALSESLDAAMAARLGEKFDEGEYIAAYQTMTMRTDRERQLAHVRSIGHSLCELVCIPLIGGTLRMMRGPAKLAKLPELHSFLERGFTAFKSMKRPHDFIETIIDRETTIMKNLYMGRTQPFNLHLSPSPNFKVDDAQVNVQCNKSTAYR